MHKQAFISIICFFLLANSQTKACECFNVSFTADSDKADLIFEGVAIDKRDSLEIGKVFYTFRLNKVWKGNQYPCIIIKTNYGGPACGASFEIDKEYVVFVTNFETTRCRRNSEAKNCPDIVRLNYKYNLAYKQKIALDTSALFSKVEEEYFKSIKDNIHFKNKTDSINFEGEKIAFLDNNDIISKQEFFNRYGAKEVMMTFEKIKSIGTQQNSGYYGIIIMHRKNKITKRQKRKIIQQLL